MMVMNTVKTASNGAREGIIRKKLRGKLNMMATRTMDTPNKAPRNVQEKATIGPEMGMNMDDKITNQKMTVAGVLMKTGAQHPGTNGLLEGAKGDMTMTVIEAFQVL